MSSGRSRYPFTATQWQELELQALVFKYMISGMPIPPDLLFTIRTSLDSSISSAKFLLHQVPQHVGWNSFHLGFGRKVDPEPGRCRRTDGKKWRCSKEAYPDSKYCERHMHRGRNRSRKPVETPTPNNAISSITKNPTNSSSSTARKENPTNYFFLESNAYSCNSTAGKDYSYGNSGTSRNVSTLDDSWQVAQLTMGSSLSPIKNDPYYNITESIVEDQQPKKIMHHFLDEWPPEDNKDPEDKSISQRTQLSISIPNALHDFFVTQNEK
ncbi:growth-regulating factor 1-like [Olea europaea subsp. europaea]|uniref:Growth-regulating factor n=1 Tax=Olea europaea subsp. europaea TaxID=158383 RepID=A0A8S0UWG4_OLEEU|nr:growth-regulating factor 1-like [Olea europaea subsp. europaea]